MEDDVLTHLLAERAGLPIEQLQAMRSADPTTLLMSQLANGGGGDPLMLALLGSMLRRSEPEEQQPSREQELERMLLRSRTRIRELRDAYTASSAMLSYLAQVFGACPACWGQNPRCPTCAGQGVPGYAAPLADELLAWVESALRQIGMRTVPIREDDAPDRLPIAFAGDLTPAV